MQGVEISHLNAAIGAVLKAFYDLLDATVEEALRPVHKYGKSDTLGMDAMPEITIVEELARYDRNAIVVTEEAGSKRPADIVLSVSPRAFRTVFISDPTDRSSQFKDFLVAPGFAPTKKVGDVLRDPQFQKVWGEKFSSPISITGASSAISCVRRGVPIFGVIINYITQQMFVSCDAGNFVVNLPIEPADINLSFVRSNGQPITFPGIDSASDRMRKFVTFLGKEGYRENLVASRLVDEKVLETMLHYGLPGGPLRVLYLSGLQATKPSEQVGFILANGEKIGEWIHWLPFVRFARDHHDASVPALRLFEVYQDRPGTKDGVLMATPPIYSPFQPYSENDSRMVIDVNGLSRYPNPSKVRATLIVAPHDNRMATRAVSQYGYRHIVFHPGD